MYLVLMGVKKAFDKRVNDGKERRKEKIGQGVGAKRKLSIEKIVKMMFEYFWAIPEHIIRLRQNTYKHTSSKKRDQRNTRVTKEDKELNREISSKRIIVENVKSIC
ncbi:hypothetical protein AGMMS49593_01820 [Endomicrobiia bacterium]|nr:hypothetical protein AGMMS49593_01820 [Endomicrobiia bacterium]